MFNGFEVEKHFCVRQTARNGQIVVPDRNCILATSNFCPIQRMLSEKWIHCYRKDDGTRSKSIRRPLKTISPRQVAQMLSETVFRTFIRPISWEEIEL